MSLVHLINYMLLPLGPHMLDISVSHIKSHVSIHIVLLLNRAHEAPVSMRDICRGRPSLVVHSLLVKSEVLRLLLLDHLVHLDALLGRMKRTGDAYHSLSHVDDSGGLSSEDVRLLHQLLS